jgi:teichoic acid transport system ATP-binding protein
VRSDAGSVFLVSHSLDVVQSTCTRAIWLDAGKVQMDGPPEDVIAAYKAR